MNLMNIFLKLRRKSNQTKIFTFLDGLNLIIEDDLLNKFV